MWRDKSKSKLSFGRNDYTLKEKKSKRRLYKKKRDILNMYIPPVCSYIRGFDAVIVGFNRNDKLALFRGKGRIQGVWNFADRVQVIFHPHFHAVLVGLRDETFRPFGIGLHLLGAFAFCAYQEPVEDFWF
jgi:hypothetical protein